MDMNDDYAHYDWADFMYVQQSDGYDDYAQYNYLTIWHFDNLTI